MKIYVASSWRNEQQQNVVRVLREAGHEVYDFKNPAPEHDSGFRWSKIDPNWREWTPEQFRDALKHPVAQRGFASDMRALEGCEACVMVLPCGRSASLEMGWAVGAGKLTVALLAPGEPELMLAMVDHIATSLDSVLGYLASDVREVG